MLLLKYDIEVVLGWDPPVKKCCEPSQTPGEPNSSDDCCYDTWTNEFKEVDAAFTQADRTVTYLTNRLTHLQTQRDMWKTWKDELDTACVNTTKICQQLEIVLHHTSRISRNAWLTKRAINLLYCMLRDFYMQLDHLKRKYDYLINCIKCINNPALASGTGIMALIEDYGKKLDIVILTRDKLFDLIVSAISSANNINKNIGHRGHNYGLYTILKEWKKVFNCDGVPHFAEDHPKGEFEETALEPVFRFPICTSDYYKKIANRYEEDSNDFITLTKELMVQTKRRDSLKALRDGLTAVLSDQDVDPSKRCATK